MNPVATAELLNIIDQLRARGARMVKVHPDGGVEAIFDGPAPRPGERDVEAETEHKKRLEKAKAPRSLDDRLLRPLGIIKSEDAA